MLFCDCDSVGFRGATEGLFSGLSLERWGYRKVRRLASPRQIVKSDPINDLTNHESRIRRTHSAVGFRMHRQTLFNRVDQFLDIDWLDKKWMFVELEATLGFVSCVVRS